MQIEDGAPEIYIDSVTEKDFFWVLLMHQHLCKFLCVRIEAMLNIRERKKFDIEVCKQRFDIWAVAVTQPKPKHLHFWKITAEDIPQTWWKTFGHLTAKVKMQWTV